MEFSHISVLQEQSIDALDIKPDGIYVDATTGGGGHSYQIASRLQGGRLICIDRDAEALQAAARRLAEFGNTITFAHSNFDDVAAVLHERGIAGIDGILFDLGVSSYQLDNGERGFSYMQDAPLDMRMDRRQGLSAREIVNTYDVSQLQHILRLYGEERYAPAIARAIVRTREQQPIETTLELCEVIKRAMPAAAKREKQHPAKRTFQALRIEVNGELAAVQQAVQAAIGVLNPGGRIAVISFHSLEDRIVKQIFAQGARGCTCPKQFPVCVCGKTPQLRLVSKGALTANEQEQIDNPRARSAKLRVAQKEG